MNPVLQLFSPKITEQNGNPERPSRSDVSCLLKAMRGQAPRLAPALAARLGLTPLGCVLSRRAGQAPEPSAAHRYMEALANNLPLRAVLGDAAAALAAASVPAIVYKGQDYLDRLYGDPGARAMADVDLLVRERDLPAAERALIDAGFLPDTESKLMHERKFCKDGLAIDLHHALLQPARMRVDHDALFARAVPSRLAPTLLALEPTDALLAHCVNQTVKGYALPASSYLELQVLLAHADYNQAIERAKRYGMCSALYLSLRALGELGHARAAMLAGRVPLTRARKLTLDASVLRFALASFEREPATRATLLAVKATLIDDPLRAARFVSEWALWQLPWTPARPVAHGTDPPERNQGRIARA
jgi:hypothetical protein